ncbi:MAG TPA: hypothetical protein PLT68_12285 [Actinomycetota bacterium]|nr:hypothetical protein [Actinomycetota bacterium]
MRTVRLQATMRAVGPRTAQVVDVPASITLDELHEVQPVAIGWTDSHIHRFRTDDTVYGTPSPDWDAGDEIDEHGVSLSTLPSRFV